MILSFLAGLKPKLWALGAAILAFVAVIVRLKWVKQQRDSARYERDKAVFQVKQRKAVDDNLAEVDQTFSRRAALRQQEKQDEPDKVPDRLRDNNRF